MKDKNWDIIIGQKSQVLDLDLKAVWQYKDLLFLFIKRDFIATFKQTILGPLWFFIQPILTALTLTIIFGHMANLSSDGTPRMLFYLSGLIGWNYFSECFVKTSDVFTLNQAVFGKVYFPRLIVPLSIVISNLLELAIQVLVFIVFWTYYYWQGQIFLPTSGIFLFPVLVLLMMGIGLSTGMIFSSLTTKYRDLSFLLNFGVQLLMYATPVIYPTSMLPEKFQMFISFNPLSHIIEALRFGFLGRGELNWSGLLYSFCFMCITFVVGIVIFSKVEKDFMDTV